MPETEEDKEKREKGEKDAFKKQRDDLQHKNKQNVKKREIFKTDRAQKNAELNPVDAEKLAKEEESKKQERL